jgi:DNA-directed RNA polymerase subunit RPC12/RpoP
MMKIKLEIVKKSSEEAPPVRESKAAPFIRGNGDVDYICGNCEAVLAEKMRIGQIKDLVYQCPTCGKLNKFP